MSLKRTYGDGFRVPGWYDDWDGFSNLLTRNSQKIIIENMLYNKYGSTGIDVSRIGFGGMRFADSKDHEKSVKTLLHAFEKGINYFDTAPFYCDDQSEIIFGKAIREFKKMKKPFYVSSKCGEADGDKFRASLEKTLSRLGLNTIDFFHVWCLLSMEEWERRKKGGAVDAIFKAKEEGLIRHVFFSSHQSGDEIKAIINDRPFDGVTFGFNAINFPFREEGIKAVEESGIGLTVMNPLGGGVITANEEYFNGLKIKENQTILDACLHFLLSIPAVNTAIVGFRNTDDVDTAVESLEKFEPYTKEDFTQIEKTLKEELNALCTTCGYCKNCPVDIPVWKLMDSANYLYLDSKDLLFSDSANYTVERLKYHWNISIDEIDRCTKCQLCEETCTQHLPILERFEQLRKAAE